MAILNNLSDKSAATTLALLMLGQMVMGLLLNFHFLKPILHFDGTLTADALSLILGCATVIALLISSLNLIFALLLPKDKVLQHIGVFIPLLVFAAAGITLCAIEYAQLAKYVSFLTSADYASTAATDQTLAHLKKALATGRNEAHFFSIIISSLSLLFFYTLMLRAAILPSYLAGFALFSIVLQLIAVGHTFFELTIPIMMQLPLAVTQLVVPVYLLIKGYQCAVTPSIPVTKQSQ